MLNLLHLKNKQDFLSYLDIASIDELVYLEGCLLNVQMRNTIPRIINCGVSRHDMRDMVRQMIGQKLLEKFILSQ
jgi:hypothetical protein